MMFLAELAQTKPTTVENTPGITLVGLGFSQDARMTEQQHIQIRGQTGSCRKTLQENEKFIIIFSTTGAVLAGPAGPSTHFSAERRAGQ